MKPPEVAPQPDLLSSPDNLISFPGSNREVIERLSFLGIITPAQQLDLVNPDRFFNTPPRKYSFDIDGETEEVTRAGWNKIWSDLNNHPLRRTFERRDLQIATRGGLAAAFLLGAGAGLTHMLIDHMFDHASIAYGANLSQGDNTQPDWQKTSAVLVVGTQDGSTSPDSLDNSSDLTQSDDQPTSSDDQQSGSLDTPAEDNTEVDIVPAPIENPDATVIEPSLEATPTPNPTITYNFEPGVSSADQNAITRSIDNAKAYMQATFGLSNTDSIFVNTKNQNPGYIAESNASHNISIYTQNPEWTSASLTTHTIIPAQEYIHIVLQYELSNTKFGPPPGPIWLTEGSANFLRNKAADWGKIASYSNLRACDIWVFYFSNPPMPSLQSMEDQGGWFSAPGGSIHLAALAVEQLVSARGINSLRDYYKMLGDPNTNWQTAFQTAFGISPTNFYSQFEQWRKNVPHPTGDTPCIQ